MKLFPVAAVSWALVGLSSVAQAAPQGEPTASVPVPIEANGLVFELRLSEGRTRFQQGETIPIRLLFSNKGTQTLGLDTYHESPPSWAEFASFKARPDNGVSDPLYGFPRTQAWDYNGPTPPPPHALTAEPTEIQLPLNEYIRFDRPGKFQVAATTNHVFAVAQGKTLPREGAFFGRGPTISSAPVTIEIVAATPQWQNEQVQAWRTYWAQQKPEQTGFGWESPLGVRAPSNDLRFLGTKEAGQAMIARLGQDIAPRSSGSEAFFWRSGLIGFPDRHWLVGAMKAAIARPDHPVTQGFMENFATLRALYSVPHGRLWSTSQASQAETKAALTIWEETFQALPSKRGRARAMTVHSLLENAWDSDLAKAPVVQKQLPQLVAMVPGIFNELPLLPQQYLLDNGDAQSEWRKVRNRRFVQPLLLAWKTVPREHGGSVDRSDLILRRLYELAPEKARPLILREMASPQPRVLFETLAVLPDKSLPQLQDVWWAHLTSNGTDQDTAAQLIGRYATSALKAKVRQEYAQRQHSHMLSIEVNRGLKRYLTRVDG